MFNSSDLPAIAWGMRRNFDKDFGFNYRNIVAYVQDINSEEAQKSYFIFSRATNMEEAEIRRCFRELVWNPDSARCLYLGNLARGKIAYAIFVSGISNMTLGVLGEEIIHGEHLLEHFLDDNSYQSKFSEPTQEFLGFLGQQHVRKKINGKCKFPPIDVGNNYFRHMDTNHWIGYALAKQLAESEQVPYADVFHAEDQRRIWKIVKRVMEPKIVLHVPKDVNKDRHLLDFRKAVERSELDAEINLVEY